MELKFPQGRGVLRLHDCPWDDPGVTTKKPRCPFLTGAWAGFFGAFAGIEVLAEETCCISKGDAYCEFVATALPR